MIRILLVLLLCGSICTAQVTKYVTIKDTVLVKGMPPVNRIYIDSLPSTYVYKFCHYVEGKDPFYLLVDTFDRPGTPAYLIDTEALTGSNALTHDNEFTRIANLLHLTITQVGK